MQSLALKYRPKTFEDVVGQDNIKKILSNQVINNSIKQAYLFTGGAGTGKTTSARIFANSINAEVLEIDGASNNGVDNIRELREKAKFRPLNKDYKVIIIDEVHMLSIGAFNALLKILEEPPAHVVFIFATTDPHKIPSTIISRVQRFDFKRLTVEQIKYNLTEIVHKENSDIYPLKPLIVSNDAIEYIAKLANGGMRDAISILDTCLGYQSELQLQDIFEILGTTNYDAIFDISKSICLRDYGAILEKVEQLHQEGKDLKQFTKSYTEVIVDMMKLMLLNDWQHVTIPTTYKEDVAELAELMKENEQSLRNWFTQLSSIQSEIKYENNPKALIQGKLVTI